MASSRKAEERKVEKRKKKKKKKVKYRKVKWWRKCKELIISLSLVGMKKGQKYKEGKRAEGRPKAKAFFLWDRIG